MIFSKFNVVFVEVHIFAKDVKIIEVFDHEDCEN